MVYFYLILLGVGAGIIGTYLCLQKKLSQKVERNREIQQQNADDWLLVEQLKLIKSDIQKDIDSLKIEIDKKKIEIESLNQQASLVQNNIGSLKAQAEESAQAFYEQSMQLAEEKLDRSLTEKGLEVQKACEQYEEDYAKLLEEYVNDFVAQTVSYQTEKEALELIIRDLRARVEAAVEANRREEEKETAKEFYRLNLTEEDQAEIAKLRSILPDLRNPEPLNKVIWKVYYEKPYTDLVGRVVGQGVKTGIYKITNIQNEKCYVGQSANIADRWRQHIKRGIGAEAPTRNKLYPAMLSIGVENFRFEVIEECERTQLNEREDYWQDYFHAKDYGYSIK